MKLRRFQKSDVGPNLSHALIDYKKMIGAMKIRLWKMDEWNWKMNTLYVQTGLLKGFSRP